MEAHGAGKVPRVYEAEGSEPSIEIKIKTLDSQTYTLRVDKQVPVPTLKEQIATVTGVLSDQQRLICCGKVLKDDQLLSAYHVEDGHTLHLVVRQPIPPPESLANHSGNEPASSASRGRMGPSVVIETFSMPDQGDGIPPEIGRIVSAVLGSFGFPNIGGGVEGIDATRDRGMQTEQASNRGGSDHSNSAFGLPTAVPFGPMHPHVMTNSLTTMSQYLSHMRREFNASVTGGSRDGAASGATDSSSTRQSGSGHESMPTPASLAEVLQSSRQFLIEDVAQGLLQLGGQLESQATNTDSASRTNIQSNALRTGFQLYNLGALLLELGRTTMTVRLGQAPPEAVVNAGPAVFINSSGPNPLMVQPIPFQWGTSGGNVPVGLGQTGSSSGSVIGSGFLPRRIDIQIRRGPSTVTINDNQSEHGDALQPEHGDTRQQQSGQRQATAGSSDANHGSQMSSRVSDGSTFAGDPSVRLVPVRTMVAALPATFGRLPFDSSGNSMGLYYPLLGGFQNSASGNANGTRTSQPSNEHPVDGQTEQQPLPELEPQLQNIEQRIRDVIGRLQDIASGPGGNDQGAHVSVEHRTTGAQTEQQSAPEAAALLTGSIPISNLRQQESSGTGSININVVSAGMNQNNHEPGERVPPNMFFDFLGNLFSEGEAQGENTSSEPAINGRGVPETSEPSAGHVDAAETSVTDEGLFLSNILHQVMPMITEHISAAPSNTTQGEAHTPIQSGSHDSSTRVENSEVGTSRRPDTDSDKPSSKRQKME